MTITLNFPNVADAIDAMNRLNGTNVLISTADRPDVGLPPLEPLTPAFNPFALAATPTAPAVPVTPPAPVVASVPTIAPAATAVVPPVGVELDTRGLPWDHRIHGSTKAKNGDGSWRQKRNLDDAVKVAVEAELRAAQAARAPAGAVAAAAAVIPQPAAITPPPAAAVIPPPVAVAPTAAPTTSTFGELMARLAPQMQNPAKLEVINNVIQEFGVVSLAGLAGRADLLPSFSAYVDQKLAALPA